MDERWGWPRDLDGSLFPKRFGSAVQAMFRALWSLPKEEHHGREAESRGQGSGWDLVGTWGTSGSSQYDLIAGGTH